MMLMVVKIGRKLDLIHCREVPSLEEFEVILKLIHARQPRGFGFIQYMDPADAEDAKYQMDGEILHGRELTVVFAEENRKKPSDMRAREGGGRSRGYDRRRSPPRYSRSLPRGASLRSREREYYSPPPRHREYSRSVSPAERSYPQQSRERSYSRSPPLNGSRSRSRSQTRERRPNHEGYERRDPRDRSPSQ